MTISGGIGRKSMGVCFDMRRSCAVGGHVVWSVAAAILMEILSETVRASTTASVASGLTEEVACFNTIFSISCSPNRVIVFDSARYGRNDTHLAGRCGVPFSRHCDIDVHFLMNRACAGRRKCNVMVNTALFGDPCGYEEFLRITYLCVPASVVHNTCFSAFSPTLFDHGYLSTPNYPEKYYMDADCTWKLAVQSHQTIRVTIFDFELDLKRAGSCKDFVEIFAGDRFFFKDCGILGKQTVEVNSSNAVVRFVTGQSSLTQRGFFLYFEGVGPGCPNLMSSSSGVYVAHFLDSDVLTANVSCLDGLVFAGHNASFLLLRCIDSSWNQEIPPCIPPDSTVVTPAMRPTVSSKQATIFLTEHGQGINANTGSMSKSASAIGFALGVMSAVLFVVLVVLLILYCFMKRKRRSSGRNIDKWRVVINNLQDHATKQEQTTYQHFSTDDNISNILRSQCPRRPPFNRSAASVRTNQTQQLQGRQQSALLMECNSADTTQEKGSRPTWIEIPRPVSGASECHCRGSGPGVVALARSSVRAETPSVSYDGAAVNSGTRTDCPYLGRSRPTLSPCCSYWGTLQAYRVPATDCPEPLTEVDLDLNSPDFTLSHSAPDLFTIARYSDRTDGSEDNIMVGNHVEHPSEHETLLQSPDGNWPQRDNPALSPLSPATKLPLKDCGVFSNVLRASDKRID